MKTKEIKLNETLLTELNGFKEQQRGYAITLNQLSELMNESEKRFWERVYKHHPELECKHIVISWINKVIEVREKSEYEKRAAEYNKKRNEII